MTAFSDEKLPAHGDDELALTRADLVACVEAFRLGNRAPAIWGPGLGFFGGLASGAVLATLAEMRGWAEWLPPAFFALGWVIAIGSFATVLNRTSKLRRQYQWACPHCGAEMIAAWGINPLARAELAIASGRCSNCGGALCTL